MTCSVGTSDTSSCTFILLLVACFIASRFWGWWGEQIRCNLTTCPFSWPPVCWLVFGTAGFVLNPPTDLATVCCNCCYVVQENTTVTASSEWEEDSSGSWGGKEWTANSAALTSQEFAKCAGLTTPLVGPSYRWHLKCGWFQDAC